MLSEDLDALMAAQPTTAVRFLPGHDQWVIGPGTKDEHVVPKAHRTQVTRKANLVLAGGTAHEANLGTVFVSLGLRVYLADF